MTRNHVVRAHDAESSSFVISQNNLLTLFSPNSCKISNFPIFPQISIFACFGKSVNFSPSHFSHLFSQKPSFSHIKNAIPQPHHRNPTTNLFHSRTCPCFCRHSCIVLLRRLVCTTPSCVEKDDTVYIDCRFSECSLFEFSKQSQPSCARGADQTFMQ